MAFLIGGANSAAAAGGYTVDNSCRFAGADDHLIRSATGTSSESNNKWTFSCWVKRAKFGAEQMLMDHRGSGNQFNIRFMADDSIQCWDYVGGALMQKDTTAVYRDPSAWYHILWSSDRSISSPTTKLWVNGTEVTSFATNNEYSQDDTGAANQNYDTWIGEENSSGSNFEGYLSELVWLDGVFVSDATDFGEFDEDSPTIWKPIDVSELTFGTNGFYLDFEDSANLGNDANGGTDFSETGIAAADQATDTPTNNFAVLNPLDNFYPASTFSQGNCVVTTAGSAIYAPNLSTMGFSSGKWYWEFKAGNVDDEVGIQSTQVVAANEELGNYANNYGLYLRSGKYRTADAEITYSGTACGANDIVSVAVDLDNNKLYFAKNGAAWMNSGDPTSGATGTGAISITAASATNLGNYFFGAAAWHSTSVDHAYNFGGCSGFAVSSANQDSNGYGNFEYAVPSGYFAPCTKNIAEYG